LHTRFSLKMRACSKAAHHSRTRTSSRGAESSPLCLRPLSRLIRRALYPDCRTA
jgi:hypothetical protein